MKTAVISNYTDEQLVQKYLNGNNNALGILYNRFYNKVYHKCLSFTKNSDDAFDLAQDILMKSFSKAASFKGESKFSTWLFSITHNHCVSQMTKSNKNLFDAANVRHCLYDDDEDELEERKYREEKELHLENYMNELSELDKNILELKYHQNYSVKDLQEKFSLSSSAVKMRLLRARQKVEQIYNKHYAA